VEIRFAIMIALTASEIADIDPKRNRHGGTGSKPKSTHHSHLLSLG